MFTTLLTCICFKSEEMIIKCPTRLLIFLTATWTFSQLNTLTANLFVNMHKSICDYKKQQQPKSSAHPAKSYALIVAIKDIVLHFCRFRLCLIEPKRNKFTLAVLNACHLH